MQLQENNESSLTSTDSPAKLVIELHDQNRFGRLDKLAGRKWSGEDRKAISELIVGSWPNAGQMSWRQIVAIAEKMGFSYNQVEKAIIDAIMQGVDYFNAPSIFSKLQFPIFTKEEAQHLFDKKQRKNESLKFDEEFVCIASSSGTLMYTDTRSCEAFKVPKYVAKKKKRDLNEYLENVKMDRTYSIMRRNRIAEEYQNKIADYKTSATENNATVQQRVEDLKKRCEDELAPINKEIEEWNQLINKIENTINQ